MNKGTFSGYLGRDAELNRVASSGLDVCNFSIANSIGTKDNPKTQWIECAIFDKRAVALYPYLKKGTKVVVDGRVTVESFTSKQGEHKAAMRVSVNEIDFMSSGEQRPVESRAAAGDRQRPAAAAPARGPDDDMDDDIPF